MNIRTEKILLAVLISMVMLSIPMVLVPKTRASPAVIRCYPDPIVLGDVTGTDVVGDEFSVAVVVEDIVGAYGGDAIISWDTEYFDFVSRNLTMPWNGTTLSDTGPSPYLGFLYGPGFLVCDTVDTVAGTYSAAYACSGANDFSGSGTFYSVKLRVKKQPESFDIGLGNYITIVMDIVCPHPGIVDKSGIEITPPIIDGEVRLYARAGTHDVALTNVTTSKSGYPGVGHGDPYPVLCQNRTAKVYVTVENQGNVSETFDVTVYANDSIIQIYTVTNLASGNQETRTVIWNATGWAKGNYTIKAVAEQVPGEIDTADNTFIDKWVVVVYPGDLDNSCEVDITDVVMVTGIYRVKKGEPDYNACRDVVEDEEIDISDVVAVTGHYREKDC